jgi:hypothetical protein
MKLQFGVANNPEQAGGVARGTVASSSELRSSSTPSELRQGVVAVPELHFVCSGLFILKSFGLPAMSEIMSVKKITQITVQTAAEIMSITKIILKSAVQTMLAVKKITVQTII